MLIEGLVMEYIYIYIYIYITTSMCGTTGRWLLRLHHILGLSSHEDCNCNF